MIPRSNSITGVVATIKWGYYDAASINGYTVTVVRPAEAPTQRWQLRATVIQADAFKLTQRPLVLIAPHERGEWRWVIRTVRFDGGEFPPRAPFRLTAQLDAPETAPKGGSPLYVTSPAVRVRSA